MRDQLNLATSARVTAFKGEDLLAIARERAPDPTVFDERGAFFWRAEISNSSLDFYFTRMSEKTLKNFAQAATDGISFQDSHNWEKLGYGQSLRGMFYKAIEDDEYGIPLHRVEADFFTIPGIAINGVNTTDFIDAVRSGVTRDVSVGFYADETRCSICGNELFQGWFGGWYGACDHVPGIEYGLVDEDGKPLIGEDGKKVKKLAFAWIEDGHLTETSQVYDGATPNAANLKAELMAAAGALDDASRALIERRYRRSLPSPRSQFAVPGEKGQPMTLAQRKPAAKRTEEPAKPVVEPETPVEEPTTPEPAAPVSEPEEEETVILDDLEEATPEPEADAEPADEAAEYEEIRAVYKDRGITLGTSRNKAIRMLADKVIEQRDLAKVGRMFRTELERDVEASLVRAKGADETKLATYRSLFKRSTVEELKQLRADFEEEATARFPGRRITRDTGPAPEHEQDPQPQAAPAGAYRAP